MHGVIRDELQVPLRRSRSNDEHSLRREREPRNASSLLAAEGVDGLLVGGASLDPGTWLAITRA
jgi:hypothetical protein